MHNHLLTIAKNATSNKPLSASSSSSSSSNSSSSSLPLSQIEYIFDLGKTSKQKWVQAFLAKVSSDTELKKLLFDPGCDEIRSVFICAFDPKHNGSFYGRTSIVNERGEHECSNVDILFSVLDKSSYIGCDFRLFNDDINNYTGKSKQLVFQLRNIFKDFLMQMIEEGKDLSSDKDLSSIGFCVKYYKEEKESLQRFILQEQLVATKASNKDASIF